MKAAGCRLGRHQKRTWGAGCGVSDVSCPEWAQQSMGPPIAHPHPLPLLPSAPSAPASHHPHPLSPSTSSHRRIPSPPPPPVPSTSSLLPSLPSASSQRPAPLGWRGAFQKGVAFGAPRPRRKPAEGRRKLAGGGSKAAAGQPAEVGGRWKVEGGREGGRSRWGSRWKVEVGFEVRGFEVRGSRFEVLWVLGCVYWLGSWLLALPFRSSVSNPQARRLQTPGAWRPFAGHQVPAARGALRLACGPVHGTSATAPPRHGTVSRARPPPPRGVSAATPSWRGERECGWTGYGSDRHARGGVG